jgi:Ala-tRNA(Pro) deacylase
MPATHTLEDYLDEQEVKYVTMRHSAAYSAQELAARLHVAGRELAKTVMIKVGEGFAMVVLPASQRIDFPRLRQALNNEQVELAAEWEFAELFPDYELGAMPPFGNLFHLPVYVDRTLAEDEEIVFNDGSFATAVRMAYNDFDRLVQPTLIDVGEPAC